MPISSGFFVEADDDVALSRVSELWLREESLLTLNLSCPRTAADAGSRALR